MERDRGGHCPMATRHRDRGRDNPRNWQ